MALKKNDSEEEINRILNNKKDFAQISRAGIIKTKKEVNLIEREVLDLHKKMILLL